MNYRITREQFDATAAKVAQANQRAAKRGLAGRLAITATPVVVTTVDELTGLERSYEMLDVALGGDAPRYDGWTFLAVLDWDANAGLVVRTAPGVDSVDRTDLVEGACDHCKVNRFRNETYLLRHDDGRQVQVGSTCIKDFLGLHVSVAWLDAGSVGGELAGGLGDWGSRDHGTDYVLALAWALIKLDGFRPASGYGATTKGDVFNVLYPPKIVGAEYRAWAGRVRALADEAVERAAQVRAFIASDEFAGDSEYVRNLKAVAAADLVGDRNIGLLVSAPQAWARHLERSLIRQTEAAPPSQWIGEVGAKVTVTATIKTIRFIPGQYGTTVLYTMLDDAGNVLKWFASREALGDQVDQTVIVKATVKAHDEYRGTRQTLITRAQEVPRAA